LQQACLVPQRILQSARELFALTETSECVVVDCRFSLDDTGAGRRQYLQAHIPGAVYAHLDDDLSSPVTPQSGRHPLPSAEKFAAFLGRCGWQSGMQMVVYDDAGGAIAARLWWLMKYFGHDVASMLDGGIGAWQSAGYTLESGNADVSPKPPVTLTANTQMVTTTQELAESLASDSIVLVDARARERFTGEVEPLDSVAGHIPGSVNYPYSLNLDQDGMFVTPDTIRDGMLPLANDSAVHGVVHMCGSGVTACHNIFAAEMAGLGGSRLFAGSWSEWIRDTSRAVATGVN
jgi:thiosulfate/3-mercaptopyruvate sulfurtransferase